MNPAPGTGVVVLSQHSQPEYALALLARGSASRAYLLKDRVADADQLITAIREVARGGYMDAIFSEVMTGCVRPLGLQAISWNELEELTPDGFGELVRRRVGGGPAVLSFDIDFFDPAFAPGTGTPEVGGPSSAQGVFGIAAL